MSGYVKLG